MQDTLYTNLIMSKGPGLDPKTEVTKLCGKVVLVIVDPALTGHKGSTRASDENHSGTAIILDPLVETPMSAVSLRIALEATVESETCHTVTMTMVQIVDLVTTANRTVQIGSLTDPLEITSCYLEQRTDHLTAPVTLARVLTLTPKQDLMIAQDH